jgi:HK97 family phage portal protein
VGLLTAAFNSRPRAATPGASDDFWYTRDLSGYVTANGSSGLALSAESILRCGTVLAAVRFRGDSWAMCPPSTFAKTDRGRKEMPDHYSQKVLRNPNPWQTGNRWRHLNGVWMATWGNAYNEIVGGRRSFAEQLRPMHPSRVTLKDQRADGTLLYEYRRPGQSRPDLLGQERVLHFRDISTDGFSGLEMYRLIRNVVGIALLAEQHASTFLRKGARIAGLLIPNTALKKEDREALRDSVNADFGGASATGTLGVLPHGVDLKELSKSNRDNQQVELTDQMVGIILRFLGVPGVVVGYGEKTATYASAKEFFESGGIKHCVLPILVNVEAEEEKALLPEGAGLQIKHNLDALLRANTKDRYDAYSKALGSAPFLSVNDVRALEDWDEDPDPRHSEIRIPANLTPDAGAPPEDEPQAAPPPARRPPGPEPEDEEARHAAPAPRVDTRLADLARQFAHDNAERVARREKELVAAKAPKLARDATAWRAFVVETYEAHVGYVSKTMRIDEGKAREYCDRQAAALLAGGAAAAEKFEPAALAALALGETA